MDFDTTRDKGRQLLRRLPGRARHNEQEMIMKRKNTPRIFGLAAVAALVFGLWPALGEKRFAFVVQHQRANADADIVMSCAHCVLVCVWQEPCSHTPKRQADRWSFLG